MDGQPTRPPWERRRLRIIYDSQSFSPFMISRFRFFVKVYCIQCGYASMSGYLKNKAGGQGRPALVLALITCFVFRTIADSMHNHTCQLEGGGGAGAKPWHLMGRAGGIGRRLSPASHPDAKGNNQTAAKDGVSARASGVGSRRQLPHNIQLKTTLDGVRQLYKTQHLVHLRRPRRSNCTKCFCFVRRKPHRRPSPLMKAPQRMNMDKPPVCVFSPGFQRSPQRGDGRGEKGNAMKSYKPKSISRSYSEGGLCVSRSVAAKKCPPKRRAGTERRSWGRRPAGRLRSRRSRPGRTTRPRRTRQRHRPGSHRTQHHKPGKPERSHQRQRGRQPGRGAPGSNPERAGAPGRTGRT